MDEAPASGTPEEMFLGNLAEIDRAVRFVCRRYPMSVDEREDFQALVRLRLIEDDYRRIRSFKGRSRFSTYLHSVVLNLFRDYRTQLWGSWGHSELAKRLGVVAMRLEELVFRDDRSHEDACAIVLSEHPDTEEECVDSLLNRLLDKRRAPVWHDTAEHQPPAPEPAADDSALLRESKASATQITKTMNIALSSLSTEERVILRLIFGEGLRISQVSKVLNLDQRPLYRLVPRLLDRLRKSLEASGLSQPQISELLDDERLTFDFDWQAEIESREMTRDSPI